MRKEKKWRETLVGNVDQGLWHYSSLHIKTEMFETRFERTSVDSCFGFDEPQGKLLKALLICL